MPSDGIVRPNCLTRALLFGRPAPNGPSFTIENRQVAVPTPISGRLPKPEGVRRAPIRGSAGYANPEFASAFGGTARAARKNTKPPMLVEPTASDFHSSAEQFARGKPETREFFSIAPKANDPAWPSVIGLIWTRREGNGAHTSKQIILQAPLRSTNRRTV